MKEKEEYEIRSFFTTTFSILVVVISVLGIHRLLYNTIYSSIGNYLINLILFGAIFAAIAVGYSGRRKLVIKKVDAYCNLKGYKAIHGLILRDENNKKIEIPHLMITQKGIAIMQINHYYGHIRGTADSDIWSIYTPSARYSRTTYFQNPIKQNEPKIQLLKNILKQDIQFYNLVIFINGFNFDKESIHDPFVDVGLIWEIDKTIERLDQISSTEVEIEEVYNMLKQNRTTVTYDNKVEADVISEPIDDQNPITKY